MESQSNLCQIPNSKSDRSNLIENVPNTEIRDSSIDICFISSSFSNHCQINDSSGFGECRSFEQYANISVDPLSCSSDLSSTQHFSTILSSDEGNINNDRSNSTENLLSITIPETDSEVGLFDGEWKDSIINISDEVIINLEDDNITNTNLEISKIEMSEKPYEYSLKQSGSENLNSTQNHETSAKSTLTESNQARLVSDESVNESPVTTRTGRVVRQRLQLSFQSKTESESESDQSDYDFEIFEKTFQTNSDNSGSSNDQHDEKQLMYLDLSKELVDHYLSAPTSVQVNDDESFKLRLKTFLGSTSKRRVLYTQTFGEDEQENAGCQDFQRCDDNIRGNVLTQNRQSPFSNLRTTSRFSLGPANEKTVFKLHTPPHNKEECKRHKHLEVYLKEYDRKYNFVQSLDTTVPVLLCHPKAQTFNADFPTHRKQLTSILYDLYNHKIFNCALSVEIIWKQMFSKPSNCLNKLSKGERRTSIVEINSGLITSPKALCTVMLHELCHAAAWLFSGESGHGAICEEWVNCAHQILPGLPRTDECNRPAHLYTYICMMCDAKSKGSLTFELADRVRCNYCYGMVEIQTNTTDLHKLPDSTKIKLTGLVKYIKDHYSHLASTQIKHTEIMTKLNNDYLTNV